MASQTPKISIVTPSYNMLAYLPMCCASVMDQDVAHEHIVMDGGSTDGTVEWLQGNERIVTVSEKDRGMYHALNKATAMARGEIIGQLNCDEQYLPGVLKYVLTYFNENPQTDFLAADFLVIDKDGAMMAYRKSFQPRWQYFFSNYLYTTTCTLFYRRKVFLKCRFDESYKSIADVIFMYSVMRNGFKGVHVRRYFAVFTYSGSNLSLDPISDKEKAKFNDTLPYWYRLLKPLFFVSFFVERILNGTYSEKSSMSYSIFTKKSSNERITLTKKAPGFRLKFQRTN